MEPVKLVLRIVMPFFVAVLMTLTAYEARARRWRFIGGMITTVLLVAGYLLIWQD